MTVRDLVILGTASQHPTRFRNHGAYLLRWLNEGLLFDPGEGTQRQFIFAEVAPTVITRIFISHFHGDHCLGLGSVLMRLNLDNVKHRVKCYYPASGAKYFNRLRYSSMCKFNVKIDEIPVTKNGIVDDSGRFIIEAQFLKHGVDCIGWSVREKPVRKFKKDVIKELGISGKQIREIIDTGIAHIEGKEIHLSDISFKTKGNKVAVVMDTRYCKEAEYIARDASVLLCESTYLSSESNLAFKYGHLTAKDAATIATNASVDKLVLTHFSARYTSETLFKREAAKTFKNVIAAKDTMRVSIPKTD